MQIDNYFKLELDAKKQNEAFARGVVALFATTLNPTTTEINEIKTAVSEAVTNAIVHGYEDKGGKIVLEVSLTGSVIDIKISDTGVGINDIDMAMQPFYTTKSDEEHSGMGFTLMDSFMDYLSAKTGEKGGLIVHMKKEIKG